MRIAHCQFETWVGEFEHNLKRVEEGLSRAEAERAEIVPGHVVGDEQVAWSHREFGAFLDVAMKESPYAGNGRGD
jgi:hypothetical protein